MALNFEYLVIQNPSDADVQQAGSVGWELVAVAGQKFWFKRPVIS